MFTAILQTRQLLHVHSERIFLVGCGEGAAVAYWLGLTFPERFAGVVAINGWLPVGLRPLGRLKACRDLPILVVHGAGIPKAPSMTRRQNVATTARRRLARRIPVVSQLAPPDQPDALRRRHLADRALHIGREPLNKGPRSGR